MQILSDPFSVEIVSLDINTVCLVVSSTTYTSLLAGRYMMFSLGRNIQGVVPKKADNKFVLYVTLNTSLNDLSEFFSEVSSSFSSASLKKLGNHLNRSTVFRLQNTYFK